MVTMFSRVPSIAGSATTKMERLPHTQELTGYDRPQTLPS